MPERFGKCSMCGKDVEQGQPYLRCTVSACNSGRFKLLFCGKPCWDAHLPVARHRKAEHREFVAGEPETP